MRIEANGRPLVVLGSPKAEAGLAKASRALAIYASGGSQCRSKGASIPSLAYGKLTCAFFESSNR